MLGALFLEGRLNSYFGLTGKENPVYFFLLHMDIPLTFPIRFPKMKREINKRNQTVYYVWKEDKDMNYRVFGAPMPAVSISMEQGESIYTQSGGMTWMSEGISMETNMKGGFLKGIGRMFAGESLFMATYAAQRPGVEITLASSFSGEIRVFEVGAGKEYIAQKNAFLCATPGVELSAYVTGAKAGFFGGEGFVLQKYTGRGLAFLELDGTIVEKELAPGEKIKVDTGNIAAFEAKVGYSSEMVKGFANVLFGGEGLFLSTLTGPGKVWLQTMSASELAKRIIPFIPTGSSS